MIGYYIHHLGRGHLHRALTIAAATDAVVVGLSSLPRPPQWMGPWLVLPADDRRHGVTEQDAGPTPRMADISSWIAAIEPSLMIVDVSVEVSLLARLHGIPVVTMVLPGDRSDCAHHLVHSVARRIIAAWPAGLSGMTQGLGADLDLVTCVGGLSRFDDRDSPPPRPRGGARRVLVLAGEDDADLLDVSIAQAQTPGWTWRVIGPGARWVDDPWEAICAADVVITHAGLNAIAEVAAARRPAVVVPRPRPFREQETLAAALATDGRFPVMVCSRLPALGWAELLEQTARLDGAGWAAWNDRKGAQRVADLIHAEIAHRLVSPS